MGLEAKCQVEWLSTTSLAALHLDSQHLDVRLKPPMRVAFSAMRSVRVEADALIVELAEGRLVLQLGASMAAKWAQKILRPKSRLDKLGVNAAQRVCVLRFDDAEWLAELTAAGVAASRRLLDRADVVFLFAAEVAALDALTTIRKALAADGAIWVLRVKGKTTSVSEDELRRRAKRAGLVDVKVVAFSELLSALKLVIPVAKRGKVQSQPSR